MYHPRHFVVVYTHSCNIKQERWLDTGKINKREQLESGGVGYGVNINTPFCEILSYHSETNFVLGFQIKKKAKSDRGYVFEVFLFTDL